MELHGGEEPPCDHGGWADGQKTPSLTGVPLSRAPSAPSHRSRKPFRSTKGASKARRALLGAELRALRDLLPVARGERARLSHLHVMALTCVRARAARTLGTGVAEGGHWGPILTDPGSALPGFLLLLTAQGKIVHVADCVSEHLGHSVVELLAQGDSIYDLVESTDHEEVRLSLQGPTAQSHRARGAEVSFVCRMNTARSMRRPGLGASRPILVRGRYLRRHGEGGGGPGGGGPCDSDWWGGGPPVLAAFCTAVWQPSPGRGMEAASAGWDLSFQSLHSLDMRFQQLSDSVVYHLGHEAAALRGLSWYSLVHPLDLARAAAEHARCVRGEAAGRPLEAVLRLQTLQGGWCWVLVSGARLSEQLPLVQCCNRVLSDAEAKFMIQQLHERRAPTEGDASGRSAPRLPAPATSTPSRLADTTPLRLVDSTKQRHPHHHQYPHPRCHDDGRHEASVGCSIELRSQDNQQQQHQHQQQQHHQQQQQQHQQQHQQHQHHQQQQQQHQYQQQHEQQHHQDQHHQQQHHQRQQHQHHQDRHHQQQQQHQQHQGQHHHQHLVQWSCMAGTKRGAEREQPDEEEVVAGAKRARLQHHQHHHQHHQQQEHDSSEHHHQHHHQHHQQQQDSSKQHHHQHHHQQQDSSEQHHHQHHHQQQQVALLQLGVVSPPPRAGDVSPLCTPPYTPGGPLSRFFGAGSPPAPPTTDVTTSSTTSSSTTTSSYLADVYGESDAKSRPLSSSSLSSMTNGFVYDVLPPTPESPAHQEPSWIPGTAAAFEDAQWPRVLAAASEVKLCHSHHHNHHHHNHHNRHNHHHRVVYMPGEKERINVIFEQISRMAESFEGCRTGTSSSSSSSSSSSWSPSLDYSNWRGDAWTPGVSEWTPPPSDGEGSSTTTANLLQENTIERILQEAMSDEEVQDDEEVVVVVEQEEQEEVYEAEREKRARGLGRQAAGGEVSVDLAEVGGRAAQELQVLFETLEELFAGWGGDPEGPPSELHQLNAPDVVCGAQPDGRGGSSPLYT